MRNDFIAFILTHGRAGRVDTIKALRRSNYTGKICLVVDDEDEQYKDYISEYEDECIIYRFHKAGVVCDTGDNRQERRVILFARNVCFDIARELGYRYFIELDDDYSRFTWRFTAGLRFKERPIKNIDRVFESLINYLDVDYRIKTIAFCQGGDFIGGGEGKFGKKIFLARKAMNSFICDINKPFKFYGRINEDVNTYVGEGGKGFVFCQHNLICLHQKQTQSNKGGMTGAYIDGGTYIKSFYSIIFNPSCVKIHEMGNTNKRIHHKVEWRYAVPLIVRR